MESHRARVRRIEAGELKVIGQNMYTEAEPSPLQEGEDGGIMRVDPAVEGRAIEALEAWRDARDTAAVERCARGAARGGRRLRREHHARDAGRGARRRDHGRVGRRAAWGFGEYRAPTGVADAAAAAADEDLTELRERVERVSEALGRRIKILVGKPGLDGHSNGAEQIAVRARDAGMDVVYEGIRLTPARIARTAVDEGVHVVGLSILSGSHAELIPSVLEELREAGARRAGGGRRDHPRRPTRRRCSPPGWRASTPRRTSR